MPLMQKGNRQLLVKEDEVDALIAKGYSKVKFAEEQSEKSKSSGAAQDKELKNNYEKSNNNDKTAGDV